MAKDEPCGSDQLELVKFCSPAVERHGALAAKTTGHPEQAIGEVGTARLAQAQREAERIVILDLQDARFQSAIDDVGDLSPAKSEAATQGPDKLADDDAIDGVTPIRPVGSTQKCRVTPACKPNCSRMTFAIVACPLLVILARLPTLSARFRHLHS